MPKPKKGTPLSLPFHIRHTSNSPQVTWPSNTLPVEIFTLIVSYLPRSNIQNLRLVNKEFDQKVSEALFRVVVVPFRPEIYGITPEPILSNEALQGSIMLQDKGMRVFQGFGRWIQKFAMSFEIDHNRLANPPVKSDQEAITTFWGIYKWPFKVYNRYSQLEGLEQTADETRTMAKALMFIESAKELGLSIDAGLGWLAGPDINTRVAERGDKLAVFGASRFVPEQKPKPGRHGKSSSASTSAEPGNGTFSQYERMLQEAGYDENRESALRLLLETEDLGTLPHTEPQVDTSAWDSFGIQPPQQTVPEAWRRLRRPLGGTNGSESTNDGVLALGSSSLTDEDDDAFDTLDNQAAATYSYPTKLLKGKNEGFSLKPNDLSNAQREMLLEMEWAQNAFMQSWAIAIIDNYKTFNQIRTLTIARLPSRHLPTLRREDFWDSLPQLSTLSLAIIPDWREVRKEATTWVEDNRIAPSKAVAAVYDLLSQQISRRKNIKTLHFEWLCGGEYAPGLFSRNQHILPAPFVSEAMRMVNRAQQYHPVKLPYIEHLSLKNCWLSPHIMFRLLMPMKEKAALQSITFDSVSLTASILANAAPNPITPAAVAQNAAHLVPVQPAGPINANVLNNWMGAMNGQVQAAVAPPPAAPVVNADLNWFEPPRSGSWADVIDHLTPGSNLEAIRYSRDIGPEPEPRPATNLSKLSFTSCGYVRVPLDFDQTILDPPQAAPQQAGNVAKRMNDIDGFMMKPQDPLLAVIVNHISQAEAATLQNAWSMETCWRDKHPELLADAQLDGAMNAGYGRFQGSIEVARPPNKITRDY
ncbi:hypothetical protein BDZ45DRAFT_605445 [Acephala macrosclerotiorum]|nr:hypothetical protein BDZ45DRAFT_605445 [Acephala macrosclerotiorum]